MNIIEKELPAECKECKEVDCYNCDTMLNRWEETEIDKLWNLRTLKIKAVQRLYAEIETIDKEIAKKKGRGLM